MTKTKKAQITKKELNPQNFIETLRDLSASSAKSLKNDVLKPEDFLEQIIGIPKQKEKKYSGEIVAGESIEIKDIISGKKEYEDGLRESLAVEKSLLEEEKELVAKRTNELKIELKKIFDEISSLAKATQNLSEEVQIATLQAPVEPGTYHLVFFEKLLEFIKSFRKKVEEAAIWLHATNKRAEKKNYWSMYKKKGSSFLLSPDHYLQRSAG
jgi:hypothetical protein